MITYKGSLSQVECLLLDCLIPSIVMADGTEIQLVTGLRIGFEIRWGEGSGDCYYHYYYHLLQHCYY